MYLRALWDLAIAARAVGVSQNTASPKILAVRNDGPATARTLNETGELLEEFGIAHVRNTQGDALSGAERPPHRDSTRFATEPQLFCWMSFRRYRPESRQRYPKCLLYLRGAVSLLITDHNVRETLGVTDRAYIMAEGKIFRSGPPRELTEDAEVRRLYLGEKFRM